MNDTYQKAYEREKQARLEAERLLENLSRELYLKNVALAETNESFARNQQTLVQQEKMASVGFLAAGIAHEINNPLGYSLSNLGVLTEYIEELAELLAAMRKVTSVEEVHGLLDAQSFQHIFSDMPDLVAESTEGLLSVKQIVSDLQGFARSGDSVLEAVQINDAINSTLNVLKGTLKHLYPIHLTLGELPRINCQPAKLNQVFANIILNATQAMPEGGDIYIATETDDAAQQIVVTISDDGPGIPANTIGEVFSPFFTTKSVGEGTGLGLSICYAIVTEEHNGSLTVNNHGVGSGANFSIRLPVTE